VYAGVAVLKENVQILLEMLQAAYNTPPDLNKMELLAKEYPIAESISMMDSIVKAIDEGAIRTRDIVKGLRSFARTDVSHRYPYHIREGLESTLLLLQTQVKSIAVNVHYDNDIPQIMGYPSQLNQVFMNLLMNAVQASNGNAKINIVVQRTDANDIRISIADNGKGIPKAHLGRIFDPFFTTKPPGEGTGLGLAIVHGIIEKHDGQIFVDSEEGKGTTFTIILPGLP
jgi:signal transduction histidine kinase